MLQQCGIKYIGFPLRLPVHREDLSEEEAARIIQSLDSSVHGVLITYLEDPAEILQLSLALGVRIVQLHGVIHPNQLMEIKRLAPDLTVVKSLVVGFHDESVLRSMIKELEKSVDAFITDTFDPETGAAGATGKTHDWKVSRRLVEASERPVILAGGLTPQNVRRAILEVRPAGVDCHTGVEDASGRKSRDRVEAFISEARAGFRELHKKGTGS